MISDLAHILTSPLVHAPILFILCYAFIKLDIYKKTFKRLAVLPVVWLFLCSSPYPSALMIKHLEDQYEVVPVTSEKWKQTEAIVVLACFYKNDEKQPFVSNWLNCSLQRNLHAALMFKTQPMPIYLAGEKLHEKHSLAIASYNKLFFEKLNINPVKTLAKGLDTKTEIEALIPLLRGKYISLVTSASHLPRAMKYFESSGVEVLPIPVEHLSNSKIEPSLGLPNASSIYRSERAIHEYLGLIYQWFIR
ncbi:YdcF family protein [Paraglaciecola sp.]|uniref:YdcF family protein n=1 Tax=Paraglaciecola sp. TaxID=1920173 RepID=UPI003EF4CED9